MSDEERTGPGSRRLRRRQKRNQAPGKVPEAPKSDSHIYKQEPSRAGIFVTDKFAKATDRCKSKVEAIAAQCHRNNLKFRDPEFNLADNRELCLHSSAVKDKDWGTLQAADVLRVPQIFEKPQFMIDGARSSDIEQGELSDCWFLSALAMLSSIPGLVEKICVARDEKVGVYGFIFCRDGEWVDVIVDDQLCTRVSKYETISDESKQLFHNDKELFQKTSRRGTKTLLFARSAQENETWVPLIEKAYAKFHGDYASLIGGFACEAMEDMTGGVSDIFYTNDILDADEFWNTNFKRVKKDRVFGCYMENIEDDYHYDRPETGNRTTDGLYGDHAYSVLAAVEHKGKRFLKIRNPWGHSEWNGRWSDGSKEWTYEWLSLLKAIDHKFGADGSFIMEYEDFLNTWQSIERVQLFDDSWIQSAHWLNVKTRPFPSAWQYGDVSFTFTISKRTPAIIVLSQADDRFWDAFSGPYAWSFDFILFKNGQNSLVERSRVSLTSRSAAITTDLQEGDYFIHVRLDRTHFVSSNGFNLGIAAYSYKDENNPHQKLGRVQSQYALSQSMAANYSGSSEYMDIPEEYFAGGDLLKLETDNYEATVRKRRELKDTIFRRHTISYSDDNHDAFNEEFPHGGRHDTWLPHTGNDHAYSEYGMHLEKDETNESANSGYVCDSSELKDQDSQRGESEGDNIEPSSPDAHSHPCSVCHSRIVGVRWKCHTCYMRGSHEPKNPGYNLCDKCHAEGKTNGSHKVDHHIVRLETPDSSEESFNYACKACEIQPIVGVMWWCLICSHTRLCDACHSKGPDVHPSEHKMVRAENMEDAAILRDHDNDPFNYILLGLRVFTKSHTKVNIDGQLRHGTMLSWKK